MSQHVLINAYGYPVDEETSNPFLRDIAVGLTNRGLRVSVLSLSFASFFTPEKQMLNKETKANEPELVQLSYANYFPLRLFGPRVIRSQVIKVILRKLKKRWAFEERPTIMQHHYILNADLWLSKAIAEEFEIPLVVFEHSPTMSEKAIEKKSKPFTTPEEVKNLVRHADKRLARTPLYAGIYEKIFEAKFDVLPSFVPEIVLNNNSDQPDRNMDKKLVSIGTLSPRKNLALAIEAIAKVREANRPKLIIIGAGSELENLKELASKLGVVRYVMFTGQIPKESVINEIRQATAVLITSKAESFGNSVIESFAAGKPVISTRCGGPEELIINEQLGMLCDHNPESIAYAIEKLLSESSDPEFIKSHFEENYSEKVVIEKLVKVYEELS